MALAAKVLVYTFVAVAPAQASDTALTRDDVIAPPSARSWFPLSDNPAIDYENRQPNNRVSRLIDRISTGTAKLEARGESGYLSSLLAALNISAKSQLLVFSKTSLQRQFINPQNPRALYFGDDVVVAFIRGAPLIEIAAHDPNQGMVFYVLDQTNASNVAIRRRTDCLNCHVSHASESVAGALIRSVAVGEQGAVLPEITSLVTDHRSPMKERWGGWYVTGFEGARHLGNAITVTTRDISASPTVPIAVDPKFLRGYPTSDSDAAALMVFDHQMRLMSLLTRTAWDTRVALAQKEAGVTTADVVDELVKSDARALVDYMLFVDEAPVNGGFTSPGFAHDFSMRGPHDARGRSLYQLDLKTRLLRYPCSYLIYSRAFDALPEPAKAATFQRMWSVLSGNDADQRYRKLSSSDRRAIIEILRETKPGLPAYFRQ